MLLGALGSAALRSGVVATGPALSTRTDPAVHDGYVANPGMGWQDARRADPRFDQTVEYLRPTEGWAALNPAPGVYDWSIVDEALDGADERGNLLGLRIYTMRHPRSDGHKLPSWVLGAGATLIDGEPDYSNGVYQDRWATFVEALRDRYDGDPRIAFIDISGYGNYNEWSWQDQTEWDTDWRAPTSLDGQARRRLADLFLGGEGTAEVRDADGNRSTVTYRYRGFRETQLLMPYAGIRQSLWYALARRPDVGWRFDCLGQIGAGQLRELGDDALERWRRAPVVFEFCSTVDWGGVDEAVALTHPVLVHDNATAREAELPDLLASIGYRYVLERAQWPRAITPGGQFALTMWWRNDGTSLAYEALGVTPVLLAALFDADGRNVHTWTVDDTVGGWLPGSPTLVDAALVVPDDVAGGDYDLRVMVGNDQSRRPLALPLRETTDAGWFHLGDVRIDEL
ncbi:DUF4832 domain-containing protein [soil metagenome]